MPKEGARRRCLIVNRSVAQKAGIVVSSVALAAVLAPGAALAGDGSQLMATNVEGLTGAAAQSSIVEIVSNAMDDMLTEYEQIFVAEGAQGGVLMGEDGAYSDAVGALGDAADSAEAAAFGEVQGPSAEGDDAMLSTQAMASGEEIASDLTAQAADAEESDASSASAIKIAAAAGEQTISMSSVTNGTAKLISVKTSSGVTKTASELSSASTSDDMYYLNNVLKAPADSTITMELLPARGYQLTKSTICNGEITVTPVDDDDKVGYYTFKMPTTSEGIELDCGFTTQADTINSDSSTVTGGSIADASSVITSGTLRLDVSDIDDSDIKSAFNAKASSASNVVAYIDTWLYQITTQASTSTTEDVWEDPLDETSSAISITLKLSDTATSGATQFYIIREYNDNYQQASVTYDSSAKTITFKTDKFSSYAIVKGAPPTATTAGTGTTGTSTSGTGTTTSSGTTTPKTGDTNDVLPLAITSVLAAGTAIYSGRRLRRED